MPEGFTKNMLRSYQSELHNKWLRFKVNKAVTVNKVSHKSVVQIELNSFCLPRRQFLGFPHLHILEFNHDRHGGCIRPPDFTVFTHPILLVSL